MTRVPLALYDRPPPSEAPQLTNPYLPAVSAGGFDFVYRAPRPVAVPSTGKQIRIPLASQTFRTTAYYEATPALATTAFLRARVRNDGTRPLLRGPAAIFGDGELVGVGEIQTTGPSGDIELPLGANQDIRLVRQVVPSTKTTGLVFRDRRDHVQRANADWQLQEAGGQHRGDGPGAAQPERQGGGRGSWRLDPKPVGEVDLDGTIRFRVEVPAADPEGVAAVPDHAAAELGALPTMRRWIAPSLGALAALGSLGSWLAVPAGGHAGRRGRRGRGVRRNRARVTRLRAARCSTAWPWRRSSGWRPRWTPARCAATCSSRRR